MEKNKLEVGGVYKTHVGDLVKVISFDNDSDRLHLFNISDGSNQWVSLSRALEYKLETKVR